MVEAALGFEGAGAAPGRQGFSDLRARRGEHCRADPGALVVDRRRIHAGDGQCGRGAGDRLPLRAGARHADRDHGRHRAGASAGILVRNAEALGACGRIKVLAVDKTGTLTEGRPVLVETVPAEGVGEVHLLAPPPGSNMVVPIRSPWRWQRGP